MSRDERKGFVVCAVAERILRDAGVKTGLFTSPHLVTYRERIRVNGAMIPEEVVARELTRLRKHVAEWENHPTFFELSSPSRCGTFSMNAAG